MGAALSLSMLSGSEGSTGSLLLFVRSGSELRLVRDACF
jgi:hypothetical protein